MLHISAATPFVTPVSQTGAGPDQTRQAEVDFTEVLRTEEAKAHRGDAPHNNLALLEQRLRDADKPGDIRTAIADFTTPEPEGGREAFVAMMDKLHGSAHPLALRLDTLHEAKRTLGQMMGGYVNDMAIEARAVMADLNAQIEALRAQIQNDAMQKVEGRNAQRA